MAQKTIVTPWEVSGEVDYDYLVKHFGTQRLDSKLLEKMKKPLPALLRRGLFFSHRDLDKWLSAHARGDRVSIVSGRGPSEKMHLGHLIPFMVDKYFQDAYECEVFIPISDDEKFYVKPNLSFEEAQKYSEDNILDIIALGFNPKLTRIHRDFEYTKIYKYAAQIAKKVTFSTAKAVFGFENSQNLGWLFYPAMQSAHIYLPQFLYGAHNTLVPVAIDQDPYMRVLRDVAEYSEFKFVKPSGIYSKFLPPLTGMAGKMSSSQSETAVWLFDDEKTVRRKVMKHAFSGGATTVEEHRKKGGNPEVDVAFQWLYLLGLEEDDGKIDRIRGDYLQGKLLSGELKELLVEKLNAFLAGHQDAREKARNKVEQFLLKD
ncbi:MAG TPA: tryptophan--tRNA ligase [archaeon]|nr:tryptophan--tRNA ligase [archaeon]